MNRKIFQSIDKEPEYYGVYCTAADSYDGRDMICLVRKRYFETGTRQKKRSTVKTDAGVMNYSYSIEDGVALRYKKTSGSQLVERAVDAGESYYVESLDSAKRPVKRSYYNKRHKWMETSYYSPGDNSAFLTVSPVTVGNKAAISIRGGSGERILYPFPLTFDKELTTRLNVVAGEPEVFCVTSEGSFYFCTEEEAERREKALDALLNEDNNSEKPEQVPAEEIEQSFVVSTDKGEKPAGGLDLKNSREVYIDHPEKPDTESDFYSSLESMARVSLAEAAAGGSAEKEPQEAPAAQTEKAEEGAGTAEKAVPDDNRADDEQEKAAPDKGTAVSAVWDKPETAEDKEDTQEAADISFTGLSYERGEIPAVHEPECAFAGECPYETVDKQIIESGGRRYFYFGELEGTKRSGRGRTVMKNGSTAYEGDYSDDKRDGFGVYYYKTGRLCYTGSWKQNKRDGMGVSFSSTDGSVFVGQWRDDVSVNVGASFDKNGSLIYAGGIENGRRHGAGLTCSEKDRTFFVGKYRDGVFLETGTQFSAEGELLYTGGYSNNCRSGEGTSYRPDGSVCYKGEWKNDKYHGSGVLYLENGGTISGSFKNGRANGRATLTDPSGRVIYTGSFADDNYNGTGRLFSDDGSYAEGRFADGEPTGVFNEYNADKKLVYCGEWNDMHRNGRGIEYENGEKRYEGVFRDSLYHGEGKLFENGRTVYIGSFVNGKREGFGAAYRDNEMLYKGMWKDDKYSGCGIIYENGEARFVGQFENGMMNGRINEIENRTVIRRSLYSANERTYTCEFSRDGSLLYYGNMSGDMRSGMGCSFIASAEKQFEGIFRNNEPDKPMKVSFRELPELEKCSELDNTEYELYRMTPEYVIEKSVGAAGATGIYSGRLKNGRPEGSGTILFSDHRYTGSFIEGRPEGEGIVYRNSGEEYHGVFSTQPLTDCRTLQLAEITYYYREL